MTDLSLKKEAAWKLAQLTSDQKVFKISKCMYCPIGMSQIQWVYVIMSFFDGEHVHDDIQHAHSTLSCLSV